MFTYLVHLFTSVFPPTETRPYPLTEIQVCTRTHAHTYTQRKFMLSRFLPGLNGWLREFLTRY